MPSSRAAGAHAACPCAAPGHRPVRDAQGWGRIINISGLAARGSTEAEAEASLAAGVSVGRIITAAEVADVVAFLASPRSVAITGDAIAAGGGAPGAIHY